MTTTQAHTETPAIEATAKPAPRGMLRLFTRPLLIGPALTVALLLSIVPIGYLILVSLTRESSFFFNNPVYTLSNYESVLNRYRPHIYTTIKLATLSSLIDLVFGYPFAYILIRKVRYRELVRTLMVFPLFGPLYLAYGMMYILLPNSPVAPVFEFLNLDSIRYLKSLPSTLFALAMFTFPFMVMNIGAALSNVDPMLEEAARTLGAKPRQIFTRILFPLSRGGIIAGLLMCFGWNIGVFVPSQLLGTISEQRILSLTLQQKLMSQTDYGLSTAMGVILMLMAFTVTWVSLKFSRGSLGA